MNTPTPRTEELANRLRPIAKNITATTAQTIITQVVADILTLTTELETELTAARKELYRSASLSDVERRVDECIELREQRDRLVEDLRIMADGTSCRECGGEDQALLAREALRSLNEH